VEKKEIAQQVRLGIFVLVGLGLFLATVFLIGSENNIFNKTVTVSAVFRNVEGLKRGDNVWLSGVKVGTVKDVEISSQGRVKVLLSLKGEQTEFIKKDASATIGSDGLVGNKIVILQPGTSPEKIDDDGTIKADSPGDTQELMSIAKDVGQNTKALTQDLSIIAHRIAQGKGVIGEILNDGELAQELRTAVYSLQATGSNTAKASSELHQLLYDLRNGNGLVPTLVNDTTYASNFRNTLASLQEVSVNAQEVSKNLQSLTAKLNDDNNAVGVLLSDEELATRIKNSVYNAEKATEKLDENMEALQHNFLLRGYFRKQEKRDRKEAASSKSARAKND
jgi:phospholipid/cholesterol/gamma-HCH transport system substrate-binding protein